MLFEVLQFHSILAFHLCRRLSSISAPWFHSSSTSELRPHLCHLDSGLFSFAGVIFFSTLQLLMYRPASFAVFSPQLIDLRESTAWLTRFLVYYPVQSCTILPPAPLIVFPVIVLMLPPCSPKHRQPCSSLSHLLLLSLGYELAYFLNCFSLFFLNSRDDDLYWYITLMT